MTTRAISIYEWDAGLVDTDDLEDFIKRRRLMPDLNDDTMLVDMEAQNQLSMYCFSPPLDCPLGAVRRYNGELDGWYWVKLDDNGDVKYLQYEYKPHLIVNGDSNIPF